MLVPDTFKPLVAVRFAPLPMVSVPLLDVTAPVTLPCPFQLPPVTPSVLPSVPPLVRLIVPPFRVVAPDTEPLPPRVAPEATVTFPLPVALPLVLLASSVPAVTLVGPV